MEFAIVAPFLILTFFSTVGLGITMGRYNQTVQVARDIAHMYVDGLDFTQSQTQNIALQLASGTGMTANGGNGVVILSRIITVYQADCDAAGYTNTCGGLNHQVVTQRIVFGNSALRSSTFGTPSGGLANGKGNISPTVYLQLTDSSVDATSGFGPLLTASGSTQDDGQTAYVAEVFFSYPDVSYLGTSTTGGAYARFIF